MQHHSSANRGQDVGKHCLNHCLSACFYSSNYTPNTINANNSNGIVMHIISLPLCLNKPVQFEDWQRLSFSNKMFCTIQPTTEAYTLLDDKNDVYLHILLIACTKHFSVHKSMPHISPSTKSYNYVIVYCLYLTWLICGIYII